ncbi:DUF4363 family protein [Acetohalobium arabaticum]|uniref:DUF4363 domain-containing protein n=1 Tax=Acetohalobium arabaticum (strain ATCC 49924 / DSM 5501 / Z-7288) TaxID=574087 RepID=D9QRA2_ACEAZ|nr:DUF4363 family protein [Acetohalobium arabaticum]ADL13043.1 hypothetical protein Acear_1537 [Acetohalobium arabaticum DSM 5501]
MNKLVIGITIFLILLLGLSVYGYREVVNSAEPILDKLNKLETEIQNEDWQTAKTTNEALQDRWEKTQNLWTPLVDHSRVDGLENSLIKIKKAVNEEEKTEALLEIAVSRRLVQNVPNTQKINFKNIF